jgi:hypothetical protein
MEKLDSKKVQTFLKELNSIEFRYLELTVQMASGLQNLIQRYRLDKKRFCDLFGINIKKYDDYTKGNFNYSVEDMALLNANYQLLETERIKQEEQIRIATEKFD